MLLLAYGSLAVTFYSEHVETKEIIMKLLKIIVTAHILSVTQPTVKQLDFISLCNIDNFEGNKNGRSWLGPFKNLNSRNLYVPLEGRPQGDQQ